MRWIEPQARSALAVVAHLGLILLELVLTKIVVDKGILPFFNLGRHVFLVVFAPVKNLDW